jgi:hypothetical protein
VWDRTVWAAKNKFESLELPLVAAVCVSTT